MLDSVKNNDKDVLVAGNVKYYPHVMITISIIHQPKG